MTDKIYSEADMTALIEAETEKLRIEVEQLQTALALEHEVHNIAELENDKLRAKIAHLQVHLQALLKQG